MSLPSVGVPTTREEKADISSPIHHVHVDVLFSCRQDLLMSCIVFTPEKNCWILRVSLGHSGRHVWKVTHLTDLQRCDRLVGLAGRSRRHWRECQKRRHAWPPHAPSFHGDAFRGASEKTSMHGLWPELTSFANLKGLAALPPVDLEYGLSLKAQRIVKQRTLPIARLAAAVRLSLEVEQSTTAVEQGHDSCAVIHRWTCGPMLRLALQPRAPTILQQEVPEPEFGWPYVQKGETNDASHCVCEFASDACCWLATVFDGILYLRSVDPCGTLEGEESVLQDIMSVRFSFFTCAVCFLIVVEMVVWRHSLQENSWSFLVGGETSSSILHGETVTCVGSLSRVSRVVILCIWFKYMSKLFHMSTEK